MRRRRERLAKGMCSNHGNRPQIPGQTQCQFCVDRQKTLQEKRKREGRCHSHPARQAAKGHTICQECLDRAKTWQQANIQQGFCRFHPGRLAATNVTVCHECLHNQRVRRRRKTYGLQPGAYEMLCAQQNNACAICQRPADRRGLVVDHDHKTERVRGLLCVPCNVMLGNARENPAVFLNAIAYLRQHSS